MQNLFEDFPLIVYGEKIIFFIKNTGNIFVKSITLI